MYKQFAWLLGSNFLTSTHAVDAAQGCNPLRWDDIGQDYLCSGLQMSLVMCKTGSWSVPAKPLWLAEDRHESIPGHLVCVLEQA